MLYDVLKNRRSRYSKRNNGFLFKLAELIHQLLNRAKKTYFRIVSKKLRRQNAN